MMGNLNFNVTNPDYLFYTLEKKVNLGVFHTKEELINEINRLNDFYKSNGMDLSYYADKIEKLLKLFDEKYTNNNDLDLSNLKEYELSNKEMGATMNINGQNVTIRNDGNQNKMVADEIKDAYNSDLASTLGNTNKKAEDYFENLRKYVHNEENMVKEDKMENNPTINNVSSNVNILMDYARNNHIINPEFSSDGKMRDMDGNIYEVVILKDGSSKINITKTTTYNNNNPVTENKRTLESYSEEETLEKINTTSNKSILNPLEILDYLVNNYENIDYILNSYNISEEQKQIYKNMAYEEYKKIKEEEKMNEMNKQNKPKVYEYQNKEGRNGFVNAFLITIITTLFGSLCLAYMIFSIANM